VLYLFTRAYARAKSAASRRCDPGQAICLVALGCSQIFRSPSLPLKLHKRARAEKQSLIDRNCCVRFDLAFTQLLFCFPLFNCQGATGSKSCLLLYRQLKTGTEARNHITP